MTDCSFFFSTVAVFIALFSFVLVYKLQILRLFKQCSSDTGLACRERVAHTVQLMQSEEWERRRWLLTTKKKKKEEKSETELTASVLKKRSQIHKRLKERFLIRRARFVLFRFIKKRSFNPLCVLDLLTTSQTHSLVKSAWNTVWTKKFTFRMKHNFKR